MITLKDQTRQKMFKLAAGCTVFFTAYGLQSTFSSFQDGSVFAFNDESAEPGAVLAVFGFPRRPVFLSFALRIPCR